MATGHTLPLTNSKGQRYSAAPMKNFPKRSVPAFGICLALAFALCALPPFQVALEIHHDLAAADYDGHQHSEADLCKWVQHHATSSLLLGLPVVGSFVLPTPHIFHTLDFLRPVRLIAETPSRAPPFIA